MAYEYQIKGTRHLRKYTAALLSPATAAGSDAASLSTRLCDVPWTRSSITESTFPTYSKADENAAARENFDAAEWCANHDSSKRHRVYGQAAFYRFAVPEAVQGKTVASVKVTVVCDPYTPQGARISVATTEADDLPTACAECRSGDAYLAAVAPRTSAVENGSTYWYEASETVTIDYGRALGKFLLVFCGLEDYRARNGWLEGSARISAVSLVFDEAVAGLDEVNDWKNDGTRAVALAGGAQPTWLQPLSLRAADTLASRAPLVAAFSGLLSDPAWPSGAPESVTQYVKVYHLLLISIAYDDAAGAVAGTADVKVCGAVAGSTLESPAPGNATPAQMAAFASTASTPAGYTYGKVSQPCAAGAPCEVGGRRHAAADPVWQISHSGEFAVTVGNTKYAVGRSISFRFFGSHENDAGELVVDVLGGGVGAALSAYAPEAALTLNLGRLPPLDASSRVRTGGPADELLGDLSWQVATADAASGVRTAVDTFAHLVSRLSVVSGRVAQDYAGAGLSFLHADLDSVTVVPRFQRAPSATAGYAALPQPGISIWFAKSTSTLSKKVRVGNATKGVMKDCAASPSFLQGSYIAVRANAAGGHVMLTASGAVANTGLTIRLAVWRSRGAAWCGTQGFYTAVQCARVAGFADASVAGFATPELNAESGGGIEGLASFGGVNVDLIGTSDEITGALAEGDTVEIKLTSAISDGDALIIAPVPVAFTGLDESGAYFGRQSAPSSTTAAKGWARSSADLGWFPQVEIY